MILKIKDDSIRITKNKNNGFWNPRGQFWNITEININNEWYKCGLKFVKRNDKYYIQFRHPMKVDEKTCLIKEVFCEGIYKEVEISRFKLNLIKYLENTHDMNRIWFLFRKSIFNRKRTMLIFSFALIPSILFYVINLNYNNLIIHLIAENTWAQTFFFFLTISGFISIFHPFSIRKEISKEDIREIAEETFKEEKENEKIKDRATL